MFKPMKIANPIKEAVKANQKVQRQAIYSALGEITPAQAMGAATKTATNVLEKAGNTTPFEVLGGANKMAAGVLDKMGEIAHMKPNEIKQKFNSAKKTIKNSPIGAGVVNNRKSLKIAGAIGAGAAGVGAGIGISNMNDDKSTNY